MTQEPHKHDEEHESELEQTVVNEVIRVLENIFKEHDVEELFEFSDEELIEGMKRFVKLYETDRWIAMALLDGRVKGRGRHERPGLRHWPHREW